MVRRLLVLSAMVVAAVVATTTAAADSTFSNRLLYDCGPLGNPDCVAGRDMLGRDAGWVTYYQRQSGDLQVNVAIRSGDPNATYLITLYCGPTHANPLNVLAFHGVTTNSAGRANVTVHATALEIDTFCGAGSHTGHIDFDQFGASGLVSTLTSTPLNFSG